MLTVFAVSLACKRTAVKQQGESCSGPSCSPWPKSSSGVLPDVGVGDLLHVPVDYKTDIAFMFLFKNWEKRCLEFCRLLY